MWWNKEIKVSIQYIYNSYLQYRIRYGQNAHKHLHHAVAMECHVDDGSNSTAIFEKYVGHPGYQSYIQSMPEDFFLCERLLIIWAIGSEVNVIIFLI